MIATLQNTVINLSSC